MSVKCLILLALLVFIVAEASNKHNRRKLTGTFLAFRRNLASNLGVNHAQPSIGGVFKLKIKNYHDVIYQVNT
jgi:hypothetical protein